MINHNKYYIVGYMLSALLMLYVGAYAGTEWSTDLQWKIGDDEHPSAAFLTVVSDLAVGSDERIYVVQPQEALVRVFDSDGELVTEIGTRGQGPGEFVRPLDVSWVADSLWVTDVATQRIQQFAGDGTAGRSLSMPQSLVSRFGHLAPRALLSDGRVLAHEAVPDQNVADGSRTEMPVFAVGLADSSVVEIASVSLTNSRLPVRSDQTPMAVFIDEPFADHTLWTILPTGNEIARVERSVVEDENSFFVHWHTVASDRDIQSCSYSYEPQAITNAMLAEIIEAKVQQVAEGGLPFEVNPDYVRRQLRESMYVPAHLPPVNALVADGSNAVWLRTAVTGDAEATWIVIDRSCTRIAEVILPAEVDVKHVGAHHVIGVERDKEDRTLLTRYTLQRTESP